MAYNIKRGKVPDIVGETGNQRIDGSLSASSFYDSTRQSRCAVEDNVAIRQLSSDITGGVLVYEGGNVAKSSRILSFDGKVFEAPIIRARCMSGSATGLYDVPANHILGKIPGRSINYGSGLLCHKDTVLDVNTGDGVKVAEDGVAVVVHPNSGLGFQGGRLCVDMLSSLDVQQRGQSLSDVDLLLVHDADRAQVRHTTLKDLYEGYLVLKTPAASGGKNAVQYNNSQKLGGCEEFTYDSKSKLLSVRGRMKALDGQFDRNLQANGDLEINGALYRSIRTVKEAQCEIIEADNTILADTSNNHITISLPPPKDNVGRIITIKKICREEEKFKFVSAYYLKIRCESALMDFTREIQIKSNYSVRTLQSDGSRWWIVNKSGS